MDRNRTYIDYVLSLKKEDYFSPFVITWVPFHGTERQEEPIQDIRHESGIRPGERFQNLLDRLLPMITDYPYEWPLSGQNINPDGFDFSLNYSRNQIEIELVAYREALRLLDIPPEEGNLTENFTGGTRVSAPHLTKFHLTLEKASPLSTLSFQFFSKNKVNLLSLVSERDLNGSYPKEQINLDELQVEQVDDTVTILFGRPIFTKRLTFVLGQFSASSNTYYVRQYGEDFTYTPTGNDRERLLEWTSQLHHGRDFVTNDVFSDSDISDWSEERQVAYREWRDEVERRGG